MIISLGYLCLTLLRIQSLLTEFVKVYYELSAFQMGAVSLTIYYIHFDLLFRISTEINQMKKYFFFLKSL